MSTFEERITKAAKNHFKGFSLSELKRMCLALDVMYSQEIHLRCVAESRVDELEAVLEAVRSQMCWERDRDQLTIGFQDLHNSVTKVLNKKKAK